MKIISHPATKGFDEKPLSEHLCNVATACKGIVDSLDLNLSVISKEALASLAHRIALLHDLGKGSEYFQTMIQFDGSKNSLSRHSLASAIIAYQDICNSDYPSFAGAIAFKLIQRHHGNLDSLDYMLSQDHNLLVQTKEILCSITTTTSSDPAFSDFLLRNNIRINALSSNEIRDILDEITETDVPCFDDLEDSFELFLITNLIFSALISSDKIDAARLDLSYSEEIISSVDYNPAEFLKMVTVNQTESQLNLVRQEFYELLGSMDKIDNDTYSYTITAPTGIGKTLACMNFVHTLQGMLNRKRRVIYCLPYTSIIDQNYSIYRDMILLNKPDIEPELHKYIIRHHHLQDYYNLSKSDSNYDYWDYMNDLLIVESWTSSFIVSTFVQLFHTLVGNRNSTLKKLHNIINSIVILDEIQSVDPQYYRLLKVLFKVLATRFKTYIVLCTATQPYLADPKTSVELSNIGFFASPVFNRVLLLYDPQPMRLSELLESITTEDFSNLLLVLNTKKAVSQAYQFLKERFATEYSVFCLTTLQIPKHRSSILDDIRCLLKEQKKVILVSTQLIEAGVDISFQKVYRDFAPLDSVVQSTGRCNRNGEFGELGGRFYLANLTNDSEQDYASQVYNKYLLTKTRDVLSCKKTFNSSDFLELTQKYFVALDCDGLSSMVLTAIRNLNYDEKKKGEIPVSDFKLIQDNYESCVVYILSDPDVEDTFNYYTDLRHKQASGSPNPDIKNSIKLQLAKVYNALKPYQLNLYKSEVKDQLENNPDFKPISENEYYIDCDHFKTAYLEETGFLTQLVDKYSLGQF